MTILDEAILGELAKLREARLATAGGDTPETDLLMRAMERLAELDGTGAPPGAGAASVTFEHVGDLPLGEGGLRAWLAKETDMDSFGGDVIEAEDAQRLLLAEIMADHFGGQYADWKQSELVELVCEWDRKGTRGWLDYTLDELVATTLEEVDDVVSCAQPGEVTTIGDAMVRLGWDPNGGNEPELMPGDAGIDRLAGLPVEDPDHGA